MKMILSYSLMIFVAMSLTTSVGLVQEPASDDRLSEPISDENDEKENDIDERSFIKSFLRSRNEHLNAVRIILKMKSYEKQYEMVKILTENTLNIIESSRAVIGVTKFSQGDSAPLKNITLRAALSGILESCALFGDVALRLPDITHRLIKSQKNFKATILWGFKFVNETRHLVDETTLVMFDLARQELKITPRSPTYVNPYWSKNNDKGTTDEDKKNRKKDSKDYTRKKAPRMVNIEL